MILHDYEFDSKYATRVAYFSMEIGLESGMPTYSGGLGLLAGDTIRSKRIFFQYAQNVVAICFKCVFPLTSSGVYDFDSFTLIWIYLPG